MRKISKETGLSSNYAFLIAKGLLKQRLIKKIANDVFILTNNGRSFLERRRGRLEMKKNIPTLLAVARSFGGEIEQLPFNPENQFINKEFMLKQPCLTEHNLDKDITIEVVPAQSIQKSLKRLTQKL